VDARQTLARPGDAFSSSGLDQGVNTAGGDDDFYTFSVTEAGTTRSDVRVTLVYGCEFRDGSDMIIDVSDNNVPNFQVFEGVSTSTADRVINVTATQNFNSLSPAPDFGSAGGEAALDGAAGTNTYTIRLDDGGGLTGCMNFAFYVELLDNTRPVACAGTPGVITVDESPVQAATPAMGMGAGDTTIDILLSDDFMITEMDLTLTTTGGAGAGSIVMGSLTQNAPGDYTVGLTGVAIGDTYDLAVAGGTNMCSTLNAATIPVTVIDVACIGAPAAANVLAGPASVIFDPMTNTATVPLTLDAPAALDPMSVSVTAVTGTGTLVPGSLAPMGVSASYSVQISGVANGDVYDVVVGNSIDGCNTAITGGTITASITDMLPIGGGMCPIPALPNNVTAPDGVCGVTGTNNSLANAVDTMQTLAMPGDAFSISGLYQGLNIGNDNDFYTFSVTESGTTLTDVRVTLVYGCNFRDASNMPTTVTDGNVPDFQVYEGVSNSFADRVLNVFATQTFGSLSGAPNFGSAGDTASLAGAAGANTYTIVLDDASGLTGCMDFAFYVELLDHTPPVAGLGVSISSVAGYAPVL